MPCVVPAQHQLSHSARRYVAELTPVSSDFYLHGFLSKHRDLLRDQIRQRHSEWFALIETMNATAMEVMFALQTDETSSTAKVMAVTTFARAVEPFQAAAMLAEHGMVPEANACVRMTCEAAFALSKLQTDPTTFPQQLIDDHDAGRKALANSTLEGYLGEKQDAETTVRLKAVINEINARFRANLMNRLMIIRNGSSTARPRSSGLR